jgi:murein DD-endopeptidase MepM/ murein hydrolase activator NlpD
MATTPLKLRGSVGFRAHNDPVDVLLVQKLLNGHRQRDPRLSRLDENGRNSPELEQAIADFQRHVKVAAGTPGVVDPQQATWRDLKQKPNDFRLEGRMACDAKVFTVSKTVSGWLYPLSQRATESYTDGMRKFNHNRDGGDRRHAGADLYAPAGTIVRAVADGKVLTSGSFYLGTAEVTVDHGEYVLRYGEIDAKDAAVLSFRVGDTVKRGQKLGEVGKLKGLSKTMLHLEMYAGLYAKEVTLTDKSKASCSPYKRRPDLVDPTSSLNQAVFEPFVDDAPPPSPSPAKVGAQKPAHHAGKK